MTSSTWRRFGGLVLAATGLVLVAACANSHTAPSAAGSSAAHAAASAAASLAANPQLTKDGALVIAKVQRCANTQGVIFEVSGPVTAAQVHVSHVAFKFIRHPFKGLGNIASCAGAGKGSGAALVSCAEHIATTNGIGSGVITRDIVDVANQCVAKQASK